MALFGPRIIQCPRGEWTTLVSNFGTGMPKTFCVTLTPTGGGAVSGEFEEKRALWIFPQPARRGPLAPSMYFDRYWINAIYSIRIKPDVDVAVTIE